MRNALRSFAFGLVTLLSIPVLTVIKVLGFVLSVSFVGGLLILWSMTTLVMLAQVLGQIPNQVPAAPALWIGLILGWPVIIWLMRSEDVKWWSVDAMAFFDEQIPWSWPIEAVPRELPFTTD